MNATFYNAASRWRMRVQCNRSGNTTECHKVLLTTDKLFFFVRRHSLTLIFPLWLSVGDILLFSDLDPGIAHCDDSCMKNILIFKQLSLLFILLLGVSACSPVTPVVEADYSADILGQWSGTVEGMDESITFREDGHFKALVRPGGFISNTISQGTTGSISGTWAIDRDIITLKITGAVDETVVNRETTSTIQSFNSNKLVLKSDGGETSTFTREVSL